MKAIFEKLRWPIEPWILLWSVAWPIELVYAAWTQDPFLTAIAAAFSIFTPLWLAHRGVVLFNAEYERHRRCHDHFEEILERAKQASGFVQHEAIAAELESLADGIREAAPRGALLDAEQLTRLVDERVRQIRASSPEPPPISLDELMTADED